MRSPWVLLMLCSFVISCRHDPPEEPEKEAPRLILHVVPRWGNAPFQLFTEYRAPGNLRFKAEMLMHYLSGTSLVRSGDTVQVDDVRLLNLGNGSFDLQMAVPEGTWEGMRIGIGLPANVNHSDPALYPSSSPLSVNTGMHWSWSDGYKFLLFDGRYHPDPSSTTPLVLGFSVHTGRDTCYTTALLDAPAPFATDSDAVTELTLRVQVDEFLGTGNDTLNVAVENQGHGNNLPLELKLMRNAARSFYLE